MPQDESLVKELLQLMEASRGGFGQGRVYLRAVLMALAEVMSFGSHHITDLLRSVGLVEEDWTAWYRLLQKPSRMQAEGLGRTLVVQTREHLGQDRLYVVGIDNTSVPRNSQRMEGTSWHKCPRNPPWQVGIHRAQRFLNLSWLAPLEQGYSRAIPLRWLPCFPDKAVRQTHAAQVEPQTGADVFRWVWEVLDEQDGQTRLLCVVDGSDDRPAFWTGLPTHTTALVRTAKNRVLKHLPPDADGDANTGRTCACSARCRGLGAIVGLGVQLTHLDHLPSAWRCHPSQTHHRLAAQTSPLDYSHRLGCLSP